MRTYGFEMPRKMKKKAFGIRMSRAELRRLIDSVVVVRNKYPTPDTILPHPFCPKCGCQKVHWYDHSAPYPEIWVDYFCARCGNQVAHEDNSPYIHVLSEMRDE